MMRIYSHTLAQIAIHEGDFDLAHRTLKMLFLKTPLDLVESGLFEDCIPLPKPKILRAKALK